MYTPIDLQRWDCLPAKGYGMMVPTLQVLFIILALKVTLFCDVEGLLQVIDAHIDSVTMVAIGVVYVDSMLAKIALI